MAEATSKVFFVGQQPTVAIQSQRLIVNGSQNRMVSCETRYITAVTEGKGIAGRYVAQCTLKTPVTPDELRQQLKLTATVASKSCPAGGASICFEQNFPAILATGGEAAACLINEVFSTYGPMPSSMTCWSDPAPLSGEQSTRQ